MLVTCFVFCRRPDKSNLTGIWFNLLCWIDSPIASIQIDYSPL